MTFSLKGQLEIDVEEASLPSARKELERGLADIEIGTGGISDQLSRDVQGATGGGNFGDNAVQMAQLDLLESIDDTLEKMAVSGGGGGGGGGASDTVLDLALAKRVAGGGGAASGIGSILTKVGGALGTGGGLTAGGALASGGALFGGAVLGTAYLAKGARDTSDDRGRKGRVPGTVESTSLPDVRTPSVDDIEVTAPEWLQDPTLQTPSWLKDLSLQTPAWLDGPIGVDAPRWLEDLRVSLPPALENLLGGGGPDEPTGPGGGVDLDAGFPTGRGNQNPFGITLDDIGVEFGDLGSVRIEHEFRNATREIERAVEGAVKDSSAFEQEVKRIIRREFEGV